ncbi:aldose 1-epimerase [Weissella uvarum]|uniref:aldose epimerase family protein n=1 Tax=Weissella uvarum TaxID=1479233 RepID=UPI0019612D62|nr:aldose epimerase family protein [Weissella uvarum]MBM7616715.1 aldose 1-epimerase [Weissella uvarum]MCM0594830.1 galactose mutarotase [Weissella uvarum]
MITHDNFGQVAGTPVERYTVENKNQTRLSLLSYAGIMQEFSVLDEGQRINLVLSSDRIEGFSENNFNINRIIGRTAGRLAKGTWEQDGHTYHVATNDGDNTLHGGPEGFQSHFFNIQPDEANNRLILTYTAKESIDRYPGDLALTVTYTLTDDDTVEIHFSGKQSGADGLFNPTVHAYFNLADPATHDLMHHDLYINADQHLGVDSEKCPTGEFVDNQGTPYDLKHHHDLGQILPEMKNTTPEQGYDDVFVVPADINDIAAQVKDRDSGRMVDIHSDRNAIVAFTESQIDGSVKYLNRGPSKPWMAVALEAQTLPDTPNHPDFGDATIKAGETKEMVIKYHYHK